MKIAFRTDASIQIGTGHVMRCLTLANALQLKGADCLFICRANAGNLIDLIKSYGHRVAQLSQTSTQTSPLAKSEPPHAAWLGVSWEEDARETQKLIASEKFDWLVVDHYAIDHRWETTLRPYSKRLMVIDDLADRPHDCDLLLDQNLGRLADDYKELTPSTSQTLVGPQYALLRPEFAQMRTHSLLRRHHPKLEHLLISLGGIDKDNHTGQVLKALAQSKLSAHLRITIIMGQHAPWLSEVTALSKNLPCSGTVLVNTQDMARLMSECDLFIGGAGGTAWERCCLGIPSLLVIQAENQRSAAHALAREGAALLFKTGRDVVEIIQSADISGNQALLLQELSQAASCITDGSGTDRVIKEIMI